jgi:hypothetical protein
MGIEAVESQCHKADTFWQSFGRQNTRKRYAYTQQSQVYMALTKTTDLKLNPTSTNVVHMSIKPQDFIEEEDSKGAKASRNQSRDGADGRSPGCRCVVM